MVARHLIRLFALSTLAHFVTALDFYVSVEGSDSNDCSAGRPCKSLQQVQLAVRNALQRNSCEDITVNVADGSYFLSQPLNFISADSGCDGHPVVWKASGSKAVISGGTEVTGWTLNDTTGIYSASVSNGIESRNLYVNGWASNYARQKLNRKDFTFTNSTIEWNSTTYDWLMTTPGIAGAEIRAINSFTDRYAPIEAVGDRALIMTQNCWENQVIGYDTIPAPNADFGFWIQNALSLLHEGGQYYLDSEAGTVYYMPLAGEDMSTAETYLGILEALLITGGTYDEPIHDISFEGLNFVCLPVWLSKNDNSMLMQSAATYHVVETGPRLWLRRPTDGGLYWREHYCSGQLRGYSTLLGPNAKCHPDLCRPQHLVFRRIIYPTWVRRLRYWQ